MLAIPSLLLFAILVGTDAANLIKSPLYNPHCGAVPKAAPIQKRLIVGGLGAQPEAWPWQVAVLFAEDREMVPRCGGTLITSEFVLTAAHCVVTVKSIVAGEHNLADRDGEGRQERLMARAFVHPKYEGLFDNDIALLKLDRPLQLTKRVWPACLPSQGEELKPLTTATILGWGVKSYRSNPNGKPQMKWDLMLREAHIPVVNLNDCKQSYGGSSRFPFDLFITHDMVCAGYKEGQTDSCYGDSGGPLLVERDSRWYVHGVIAFGDGCGEEGRYGVYIKTSSYINWINQIVSKFSTSRSRI